MARSTAFNPEEKLKDAMMLFWAKGYEATSMQDIVDTLAINRFSIYNTFGDKKALYAQSVVLYIQSCFQPFLEALQPADDGIRAIKRYLEQIEGFLCSDVGVQGCFMCNNMSETEFTGSAVTDETVAAFAQLHKNLVKALQAGIDQGQLKRQTDAKACAEYIFTFVQGLQLIRKTTGPKAVQRNIAFLNTEIESW